MSCTKAQAQLRYFEAMSRVTQLEILAEQLQKLAVSYGREERAVRGFLREANTPYGNRTTASAAVLRAQADELRAVAHAWHREARADLERNGGAV